jgi:hypothetical protein
MLPIAALALGACGAQQTQPASPREATSTTSTTSAALTTSTTAAVTPAPGRAEEQVPQNSTPMPPKYRAEIAKNAALDGIPCEHIQIEDRDGHVTLRGVLPTVSDKVQVELSVRQVSGVSSVKNEIRTYR